MTQDQIDAVVGAMRPVIDQMIDEQAGFFAGGLKAHLDGDAGRAMLARAFQAGSQAMKGKPVPLAWYTPTKAERSDVGGPEDQRWVALVTHENADSTVNLAVFDASGVLRPKLDVSLKAIPAGGFCERVRL